MFSLILYFLRVLFELAKTLYSLYDEIRSELDESIFNSVWQTAICCSKEERGAVCESLTDDQCDLWPQLDLQYAFDICCILHIHAHF